MQQSDEAQPIEYITPDQPGGIPGWREGIPVIRLFTCGLLSIEILQEVSEGDPVQTRYEALPAERLRGAGPAPACKLLKLQCSLPERYASKDWLMTHLREGRDPDQSITPRRLENIVSMLRKLVCFPSGKRLQDLLTYERATHESGDGYQLAGYPLVWVDADALAWNVKHACLKEQFREDAFPYWQRACAPRHADWYPRYNREKFGRIFLDHRVYLTSKDRGENSIHEKHWCLEDV